MSYKLKVSTNNTKRVDNAKETRGIRNMREIMNFIGVNRMALRKAINLLFIITDVNLVQGRKISMNWIYRHVHSVDLKYLGITLNITKATNWICIKIFPEETKIDFCKDEYIENMAKVLKANAFFLE